MIRERFGNGGDMEKTLERKPQGRKAESRRRLLDAARRLFVEHGYHDTRPQDISKEAGVGHGTFYLHFEDKRACFLAFVDEAREELNQEVDHYVADATSLDGFIRGTLTAVFAYSAKHPGVLRAAVADMEVIGGGPEADLEETIMDVWGDGWTERIIEVAADGLVDSDFHMQTVGHAIPGLIYQAFRNAVRRNVPEETAIDTLTRFIVRALQPQRNTD